MDEFSLALLFYLTFGAAVAVAAFVAREPLSQGERLFRTATALLFWPLYLPVLLRETAAAPSPIRLETRRPIPRDEMAAAIAQVERELELALGRLDGWAEDVLARECGRVAELQSAWRTQADRIRELDELLALPEFLGPPPDADPVSAAPGERFEQSRRARLGNIARLKTLRRQMYDDLMGTLAWVRELVTMIHLARYTGAPAARAEELVAQIAASVEGLSEVTNWKDELLEPVADST